MSSVKDTILVTLNTGQNPHIYTNVSPTVLSNFEIQSQGIDLQLKPNHGIENKNKTMHRGRDSGVASLD